MALEELASYRTDSDPAVELMAVVGMAGRFPGANDLHEFWASLAAGREGVREIAEEEFLQAGGHRDDLADPNLVRMASVLPDSDRFDAGFFGYSPADAEIIDPQQRILLETAYHALEDAGYADEHGELVVGVYAGGGDSRYYAANVYPRFAGEPGSVAQVHAATSNSLGTLATRLSYDLGLTGPSVSLNTACSTGLVAVHAACEALAGYACDMAVVGAVSVNPQALRGYRYAPGGPFSPDGHCRPFSADATGMIAGDGVGVLVLRRLADALADGDRIRAVVRGSAINNDGRRKVGFTAPSPVGQAEAIVSAHVAAGVDAATVTFVEAHGTATRIGDPIEVAALTQAYRQSTDRRAFCALGSVKGNIGHLGAAAGMAGLIKTVLALEHQEIPPTLHQGEPNPLIDFAASPFRVPARLEGWLSEGPRRAGVSAFGVGGTNAHVVLEEAPACSEPDPGPAADHSAGTDYSAGTDQPTGADQAAGADQAWLVLPVSARTADGLAGQLSQLGRHLSTHSQAPLPDVARALRSRVPGAHRYAVAAASSTDAASALTAAASLRSPATAADKKPPRVAFLLPGGGTQYVGMGAGLYREDPAYRDAVDSCAAILRPVLGRDIRSTLHDEAGSDEADAFVALAVVEYALAQSLAARNVRPDALLGHSLGEYVAACLAGVLTLEEMLPLLVTRVRLIISAGGATVGVSLSEQQLTPLLGSGLSLAAVNSPSSCTVAGSAEAVDALIARLDADGVHYRRLRMPAAAHSVQLDPILDQLAAAFARVDLRPPRIPYLTNVTGTWVTDAQATSVAHWVEHTRRTVRFADGIRTLRAGSDRDTGLLLVEIGPGDVLTRLASAIPENAAGSRRIWPAVTTMRHARASGPDGRVRAAALGQLWSAGVEVDLAPEGDERTASSIRSRIDLPGYAFARDRHWIDPPGAPARAERSGEGSGERAAGTGGRSPRPQLAIPHVAPRTEIERAVIGEWEAALGIDGIGVDDNFFDLGGDSMRAVLLGDRLRQAGVLDVPAAALLATPTVAGLLDRTGRGGATGREAFAPLLTLRTGSDLPPLFCVHPIGGVAWRYAGLLPHLDPRRPVYGLQALGLDGSRPLAADAAEVVRDCLERIRAVQPHGPYHLLGWSFGGAVAHRLATSLQSEGEELALLAMLDTPPMDAAAELESGTVEAQAAALVLRLAGLTAPPEQAPATVAEALVLLDAAERDPSGVPGALSHDEAVAVARVVANNLRLTPGLLPARLHGDVLFVSATDVDPAEPVVPGERVDRSAWWRSYVDGVVEDVSLACSHYAMTDPGPIKTVARAVEAHLARPRTARSPRPHAAATGA